jgi:hypothetical protein
MHLHRAPRHLPKYRAGPEQDASFKWLDFVRDDRVLLVLVSCFD